MYYLNEAGRGLTSPGIGPVYSASLYTQREQETCNFVGSLFRWARPLLWSGVKAVGRETLRNDGNILTDIAQHKSPEGSVGDIVY